VAVVGLALGRLAPARAADDEHSALKESLYTGIAVVANVMPGVSALYAPTCLPGYILCKASFALVSLVAAGEQILMSGAQDWTQTEAILHRGFAGDWYLTARHVSGEATPQVHPEPPPSTSPGGGQWEPPPR
jgi:hypothetical protein